MTWADFIRSQMAVLSSIDFFTVEVLAWRRLVTYYVLFFLYLETRLVTLAGLTRHPTEEWMVQMARNAVDAIDGTLLPIRFALHDRDSKFCLSFRAMLRSGGVQCRMLPARSPNLNAFAERWVRCIRSECLSKLILFGETSLRRTLMHSGRTTIKNATTKASESPALSPPPPRRSIIHCRERLGGLLKFYQRAA